MTQTPRTLFTALLATLALLAAPALASAEYLVPDGNSAVTQYTEGFPTGGGEKKTEGSKHVTPAKAIGAGNAKKLEQHGAEGAAVAEVAAETAPAAVPAPESSTTSGQPQADGKKQAKPAQQKTKDQQQGEQDDEAAAAPVSSGEGPSGSSGAGEVLGAATGASSGSVGLLLPLAILAAIAWALFYLWRQRRQPPAAPSQS
jgi:hypothetical protein